MEIGGALIKGELSYNIQSFCLFYKKKGENSAQILIHLVLQNNKKGEIVTLTNFFDFVVLQNIIEFNKFSSWL
jgi:ABC-type uncharacterized transport system auxiliary subunit